MIVESDVKMQDMLRELFKKNGYRVLVSADPEPRAVAVLRRQPGRRRDPVHHQQQRPRGARSLQPLRPGIADARHPGRAAA